MTRLADIAGRLWRKDIILIGNAAPAFVNFAAHVLAARVFGLELFGLWAAWRSAAQLLSVDLIVGPGLALVLPRRLADNLSVTGHLAWARRTAMGIGVTVSILGGAALTVVLKQPWQAPALAFVWLGLYASSVTSSIAQGRQDGVAFLRGSLADLAGGLLCVAFVLMERFDLFVFGQGLRMMARAAAQWHPIPPGEREAVDGRQVFRTGLPFGVQGLIQTAAQYGDRLVLTATYGVSSAGLVALGANGALPVVMLGSTAATWLLPVLRRSPADASQTTRQTLNLLFGSALLVALMVPLLGLVVPEARGFELEVSLAYAMLVALGLLNPTFIPLIAMGRGWAATAANLAAIFGVAAIFAVCSGLGALLWMALTGATMWVGVLLAGGVLVSRAAGSASASVAAGILGTLACCGGIAVLAGVAEGRSAFVWPMAGVAIVLGLIWQGPSLRARLRRPASGAGPTSPPTSPA